MPEGDGTTLGNATAKITLDIREAVEATRQLVAAAREMTRNLTALNTRVQTQRTASVASATQVTTALVAQYAQVAAAARTSAQVQIQQAQAVTRAMAQQAQAQQQQAQATARAQQQQARAGGGFGFGGGGIGRAAVGGALGSMGGPVGAIAGAAAAGGPAGIAAAAGLAAMELGKAAIAADTLAASYRRQSLVAEDLAGSQAQLNRLLESYREASGGTVDDVTAMSNVLNLISLGFANSTKQIEEFTRAARGISLARGISTESIIQQISFESMNQTGLRLDQLGLQYTEVKKRTAELKNETAGLSTQQAYANAIIEIANEKFGDLADSAEGQATGAERARVAWKNFSNELGQHASVVVDWLGNKLAGALEKDIEMLHIIEDAATKAGNALKRMAGIPIAAPQGSAGFTDLSNQQRGTLNSDRFGVEETEIIVEWSKKRTEIEIETNQELIDETRQFQSQRAETIRNFEQQIAREAQDYARQWQQRERQLQDDIAEIHRDSARQRIKWESELAQDIANAQRDSAEQVARMERDHNDRLADFREESAERVADQQAELDERIAEEREDSLEKLADLEKEFAEDNERRLREYNLDRESAAASLDAKALYELDRRFEEENKQAEENHAEAVEKEKERLAEFEREQQEAHDKAVAEEKENLQERIDEENLAHGKRLDDEAAALAKSIEQNNTAHLQRLADQVENDEQRVTDMKTAFENEKTQSDEERGIRLGRLTEDHNNQLTEMNRVHGLRITQIGDHAQAEREKLDEEFKAHLNALGVRIDGYEGEIDKITDTAIAQAIRFLKGITEAQELLAERSQIEAKLSTMTPGATSEWQRLIDRLNEIDTRLDEISSEDLSVPEEDVAGTSSVPTSTWDAGAAGTQFTYPVASTLAATGTGGRNVQAAVTMNIYGAPGQSVEQLAGIIDERIINAFEIVARR